MKRFLIASVCLSTQFLYTPALAKESSDVALQAQVEALMKRINDLEAKEKQIGVLTEKEAATTGNNLNVKLRGQVNRAVLWHSNGKNSNIAHVDNTTSSSRLNVTAIAKIADGKKIGATLEMELQSNSSKRVNVHDANDNTSSFERRKVEVFAEDKKRWGKVYLGHGSMASDGTMEKPDLSKTTVLSKGATVGYMAGGTKFYDTTGGKTKTLDGQKVKVGTLFDSGDGLGRTDRIRYDTAKFWGFKLAASHNYANHNDNWDIALKFAKKLGDLKLAAQGAYLHNGSNTVTTASGGANQPAKYSQVNGSIGALYKGFSVFFAAMCRDNKNKDQRDGSIYLGKLGYQYKFFEAGLTAFAVDYGQYENLLFDRQPGYEKDKYKGTTVGVSLVQYLERIGTEVYLGFRNYTLKHPAQKVERYKDVKAVMGGARVRF